MAERFSDFLALKTISRQEFFMGNYVIVSLELNLFFLRIMKEHSFFLEAGFVVKDEFFIKRSQWFREQFEDLLRETTEISHGAVGQSVLNSQEIVTSYTKFAEEKTCRLTGIPIDTEITLAQQNLQGGCNTSFSRQMYRRVKNINQRAIRLVRGLVELKEKILRAIKNCEIFAFQYPLLVEHILREAKLYGSFLMELERRGSISRKCMRKTEIFWNQIMMEHSWFIRGLLDPCEEDLIDTADNFGHKFCYLLEEAKEMECAQIGALAERTIKQTKGIQEFKAAGTQGILKCKIQSMILPLLADHVLREANHYLRILEEGTNYQENRAYETENMGCNRETCETRNTGCSRETCETRNTGCNRETCETRNMGCSRETCETRNMGCSRETCETRNTGCSRETCETKYEGCTVEACVTENTGIQCKTHETEHAECTMEACAAENKGAQSETCEAEQAASAIEACVTESTGIQSEPEHGKSAIEARTAEHGKSAIEACKTENEGSQSEIWEIEDEGC